MAMSNNSVQNMSLPKEWRKVRLHEIASVKTGPFGTQLHQHDYVESNGTPIITVEHLSERGLIHNNLPLVSDNDKQRLSQYLIHEGDIVFSRVGSVDRSTIVKKDEDGWLFSGRLLRLRPRKYDVHSPYLNCFFHTNKFRHHMRSIAVGGIMPSINTSILSNVIVHLPPLDEQKAIASLLETWDTAIEKTEALIAAKEKRFKWLLKTLINDQQDKPGWEKVHLDETVKIRKEKYRPVDTKRLRCIELEHIEKETARLIGETESNQSLSTKYIFRRGDILFGKLRPNLRKFAFPNFDGVCSSEIWVMCPRSEIVDNKYFFYLVQSDRFINAACKTTGSKMPRADWSVLKKLVLKIPSFTEQRTIASLLDTCFAEIEKNRKLIRHYQSQKRGLMQKLLTGSWRVIA